MSRILALDIGEKRIGVAVSDQTRTLARPVQAIVRASLDSDIQALADLLAHYNVDTLVIGYPLSLSGEEGPQAVRVKRYAERLTAKLPITVTLWDERYSTLEATEKLVAAGRRRQGDKGQVDAAAAAVILQGYLDSRRDAVCNGEFH